MHVFTAIAPAGKVKDRARKIKLLRVAVHAGELLHEAACDALDKFVNGSVEGNYLMCCTSAEFNQQLQNSSRVGEEPVMTGEEPTEERQVADVVEKIISDIEDVRQGELLHEANEFRDRMNLMMDQVECISCEGGEKDEMGCISCWFHCLGLLEE